MDSSPLPPLTPDQVRAIDAGHGIAEFVDPTTNRIFKVTAAGAESALSIEYLREKIAEGTADAEAGRFVHDFSLDNFLAEAWRRQGGRP